MKTFFAIIYHFYYKHESKSDAHFTSIFCLSTLITSNFYALMFALKIYYFPHFTFSLYVIGLFFIFTKVSSYFIYIHKNKHIEIFEDYKTKKKNQKVLYKILLFLYIVSSIIILLYAVNISRILNRSLSI